MMRKRHQDADDMARQELEHGRNPKMRAITGGIILQQQKEIRELDDGSESSPATGTRTAPTNTGSWLLWGALADL